MRRKTTEEFIKDAIKIHGNRYDYSLVDYINCRKKVIIICKKHGKFNQKPDAHLCKNGCPRCGCLKTTEQFIKDAKKVHNNRYDYSKVKYINHNKKVIIICKKHGEFLQTPRIHLKHHGCPKCGGNKKKTTEEFIEQARKIHGNKYVYNKAKYIRDNIKIEIICRKHGSFLQTPNGHLSGKGCLKCVGKTTEEFIEQARKIHGKKYDYSQTRYINARTKVKILCPKHGEFKQRPGNHLNGSNCPKCNKKNISIISQKWLDICGVPLNCREIEIKCGSKKYIVDGYIKETNTIYEFWGDYWHGNPRIFNPTDINLVRKKTFGELYKDTINKKENIKSAGYNIIDIWESKFKEYDENKTKLKK